MGLTLEQQNKVDANLKMLDYLEGTGILSDNKKTLVNEFFVFIGSGGTGCKALAHLKKEMKKQVHSDEVRKKTMFIAVDTAHNELDQYVRDGKFENSEIVKLPFLGVKESINPSTMLPQFKKWVNPQLWYTVGGAAHHAGAFDGTGAGAIRQCGRVMMAQENAQLQLRDCFSAIQRKLAEVSGVNKLKVFFLTGVAGGTGSGTIIDLAYLTRYFIENLGIAGAAVTYNAYLFLPSASGGAQTPGDATTGDRNAYAALKEIDYYMTINLRNEKFSMDYGTPCTGARPIVNTNPIFDFCTLVEGVGAGAGLGVTFMTDPAQTARQVVADSILNLIGADSMENTGVADRFMVDSFLSNDVEQVKAHVGVVGDKVWPRDANYTYSVIGYSSCVVPIDLLTCYVAKKIFDEAYKHYKKCENVTPSIAEAFLEECKLDTQHVNDWSSLGIVQMKKKVQERADEHFKAYGPYYMVNLAKECASLLESYKGEIQMKKPGVFFSAEKKSSILRSYTEAIQYFSDMNKKLYDVYTYVITKLQEMLEKNCGLLTDTHEYKTAFGKSFCWSPIDLTPGVERTNAKAVMDYLDKMLSEKEIKQLAKQFTYDLYEKKDKWTGLVAKEHEGMATFDAAEEITNFINANFKKCIDTSLESFLVKVYSGNPDALVKEIDPDRRVEIPSADTKNAADTVYRKLGVQASAMVSVKSNFNLENCYSNVYLTIPKDCKWILQAFKDIAQGVNIYETAARDRIVLCRLYSGVPLWALKWTKNADASYLTGAGTNAVGLHMEQGANGKNWAKFPNLYLEKLWDGDDRRLREDTEGKISAKIRENMVWARDNDLLKKLVADMPGADEPPYYALSLMDANQTAEQLWLEVEAELDRQVCKMDELVKMLREKDVFESFEINQTNMVMTTPELLNAKEKAEFEFDLACRTIRKFVDRYQQLNTTVTVLKELETMLEDHNKKVEEARMSRQLLPQFIEALKWNLIEYDGRRNRWVLTIGDGDVLVSMRTAIQKICAHYYGFKAFSSLDASTKEKLNEKCADYMDSASDEEFDKADDCMRELKKALTLLREARRPDVCPWEATSPFKAANNSPWPMATVDFADEVGKEEAAEIRKFYTDMINNL